MQQDNDPQANIKKAKFVWIMYASLKHILWLGCKPFQIQAECQHFIHFFEPEYRANTA